jgi:hypothetical protein
VQFLHEGTTDVFACWEYLLGHPMLRWLPPAWRDGSLGTAEAVELRAIERNLIVHLEATEHGARYRLLTGPLIDLIRGGQPDPFTPVMVADERLQGCGESFDEAVVALASAVRDVYGDHPEARQATPGPGRSSGWNSG